MVLTSPQRARLAFLAGDAAAAANAPARGSTMPEWLAPECVTISLGCYNDTEAVYATAVLDAEAID